MLSSKKHVFWQALFLTILFFALGFVMGIYLEQLRVNNVNYLFYQSETSLYDSFALGKLPENPSISCDELKNANVDFANQIYDEAKQLEQFDESSKLTESLNTIHRKYDLLRTLLWMNVINMKQKCQNTSVNTVVYLYEYNTNEIQKKSEQIVWSRILQDLKKEKGDDVILIPIAVDQEIVSLDYLIKTYDVGEYPAVVINEKYVLYELKTTEELSNLFG
ncbi:hypothetical protein J4407_01330 [Candidatus Pacearchaeota archaeon]|nr:hypothetical protein [Candidatus Pacearchaeota archaeon]